VLPLAILHTRGHGVIQHRNAMISMFLGVLVIAGLFTFVPGRTMYAVGSAIERIEGVSFAADSGVKADIVGGRRGAISESARAQTRRSC
jgi:hypothetical protein